MLYLKIFYYQLQKNFFKSTFFIIFCFLTFFLPFKKEDIKNFKDIFSYKWIVLSKEDLTTKNNELTYLRDILEKKNFNAHPIYKISYTIDLTDKKEEEKIYIKNILENYLKNDGIILNNYFHERINFYFISLILSFFLFFYFLLNIAKNDYKLSQSRNHRELFIIEKSIFFGTLILFFIFSSLNFYFFKSIEKIIFNFVVFLLLTSSIFLKRYFK